MVWEVAGWQEQEDQRTKLHQFLVTICNDMERRKPIESAVLK